MHIRDSLARGLGLATLVTLLGACAATPGTEPPALSEARYRAHVERLSSDEFGGAHPARRARSAPSPTSLPSTGSTLKPPATAR